MRPQALLAATVLVLVTTACGIAGIGISPCRGEVTPPEDPPSHHDPELEDRIPSEVAGEPMDVQSVCASVSELGGLNMTPEFLEAVGVELGDVTYAAITPRIGDALDVSIGAFRYYGASEDRIRAAMLQAVEAIGQRATEGTRADRDVLVGGRMLAGTTFYFAGDTLYMLSGDDEQVDEVLEALP